MGIVPAATRRQHDAVTDEISVVVAVSPCLFAELIAERIAREPDIRVAETCCDAAELTAHAPHGTEDVVCLDPRLVTSSVAAYARTLPSGKGRPHLVMLTDPASEYYVPDALSAGCTCFASTDLSSTDLVQAIRDAHHGRSHMDARMAERFADQLGEGGGTGPTQLTDREYDVLLFAADGLSAPATAEQLGLSVNTVRHHLQNVLTKLSVHSKLEAVSAAIRQGLIPPRT